LRPDRRTAAKASKGYELTKVVFKLREAPFGPATANAVD
jgi:hypothetical protein